MKFIKVVILFFIVVIQLVTTNLQAQSNDFLRGEIDAKFVDHIFFIPTSNQRFIALQHQIKSDFSHDHWEITVFGSEFQKLHDVSFSTQAGYKVLDYKLDTDSILYVLYGSTSSFNRFNLVRFNFLTGHFTISKQFINEKLSFSFFDVLSNQVIIAGTRNLNFAQNFAEFLYGFSIYPLFSGSRIYNLTSTLLFFTNSGQQIVELDLKGESEILSSAVDNSMNNYAVLVRNRFKKLTTYHYYLFDFNGKLITHNELFSQNKKNILTGKMVPVDDGSFAILGTYNDDEKQRFDKATVSTGIYVARLGLNQATMVEFHPFSHFNNARRALDFRLRKRLEDKQRQGQNLDFGFKLLVHDQVLKSDTTFIFIAESYYPEYHYETIYNMYGSMYSEQVFDGYRFNSAIVASFDFAGKLIWDNELSIDDIISFNLEENVIVHLEDTLQVMFYYFDGKIYSKLISGNQNLDKKEYTNVSTLPKREAILYENYGRIYPWYESNFLLTGYQIVANEYGEKRKVFFFVKIKFE